MAEKKNMDKFSPNPADGWMLTNESCLECYDILWENKEKVKYCVECKKYTPSVGSSVVGPPGTYANFLGAPGPEEGEEAAAYNAMMHSHTNYMVPYTPMQPYSHPTTQAQTITEQTLSEHTKECYERIVKNSNVEIDLMQKIILPRLTKEVETLVNTPTFDFKTKENMELIDRIMGKISFYETAVKERILAISTLPK